MEKDLLEYRILSLLRTRTAYLKYSRLIKEHLFETKFSKYIYRLLVYYHKHAKGKKRAPLSSLFALVNSRVRPNEASKYKEVISKIKKYPLTDETIADSIIKRFAKRQLLKAAIMNAVKEVDSDDEIDILKIKAQLDEAITIDSVELFEDALDYFDNPIQRLEQDRNEPRIATGLSSELDNALRGGLAAGDLGVIVAPTSVGKTAILINICYNAIKNGKKALYVTLELSGRKIAGRFDQRVTNKTYEDIIKQPNLVYLATKKLKKNGGGLKIKDSCSTKLSPQELSVYLERLQKEFEFDLVVVDQIDLMYSAKEFKERRHELSSIIIALRRVAATFGIPIWTASQATRIAGAAGKTSLWDIAEDIGKANWADAIVTLSQSPEDKEEDMMFMELAKNRIGPGNPKVILKTDLPKMKIQGMDILKENRLKKKEKKDA